MPRNAKERDGVKLYVGRRGLTVSNGLIPNF